MMAAMASPIVTQLACLAVQLGPIRIQPGLCFADIGGLFPHSPFVTPDGGEIPVSPILPQACPRFSELPALDIEAGAGSNDRGSALL